MNINWKFWQSKPTKREKELEYQIKVLNSQLQTFTKHFRHIGSVLAEQYRGLEEIKVWLEKNNAAPFLLEMVNKAMTTAGADFSARIDVLQNKISAISKERDAAILENIKHKEELNELQQQIDHLEKTCTHYRKSFLKFQKSFQNVNPQDIAEARDSLTELSTMGLLKNEQNPRHD